MIIIQVISMTKSHIFYDDIGKMVLMRLIKIMTFLITILIGHFSGKKILKSTGFIEIIRGMKEKDPQKRLTSAHIEEDVNKLGLCISKKATSTEFKAY